MLRFLIYWCACVNSADVVFYLHGGGSYPGDMNAQHSITNAIATSVNIQGPIGETFGYVWMSDPPDVVHSPPDQLTIAALDAASAGNRVVGIVGYSQGCAAGLAYVAHLFEQGQQQDLKFFACFCGYVPVEHDAMYQRILSQSPMSVPAWIGVGNDDTLFGPNVPVYEGYPDYRTSVIASYFNISHLHTIPSDHSCNLGTPNDDFSSFVSTYGVESPPSSPPSSSPPSSSPPSCPPHMAWNHCGSACPPTCTDPNPTCTKQCVPRCECPAHYFEVIGECVSKCTHT